jgi:hypothetical protein
VSVSLTLDAGETTVPAHRAGLAVLTGDSLSGGTGSREAGDLARALEGLGISTAGLDGLGRDHREPDLPRRSARPGPRAPGRGRHGSRLSAGRGRAGAPAAARRDSPAEGWTLPTRPKTHSTASSFRPGIPIIAPCPGNRRPSPDSTAMPRRSSRGSGTVPTARDSSWSAT